MGTRAILQASRHLFPKHFSNKSYFSKMQQDVKVY